ncbi:uncharacterized protein LOC116842280 [Odontomachus brunneus]|uniref:uncharacterized protein LOC116842280 n=1 Tax=Odontomachus brunneus TaxID=486640 RepID=UPI0013F27F95|nr:uncharacterized protein LOC116842280 [Odontomachus brunneus]
MLCVVRNNNGSRRNDNIVGKQSRICRDPNRARFVVVVSAKSAKVAVCNLSVRPVVKCASSSSSSPPPPPPPPSPPLLLLLGSLGHGRWIYQARRRLSLGTFPDSSRHPPSPTLGTLESAIGWVGGASRGIIRHDDSGLPRLFSPCRPICCERKTTPFATPLLDDRW